MKNFLRNIRLKILSEGNNGKYLKYAIGEIVLVVIGILFALQIDDWNENRKLTNDLENIFSAFEKELAQNIERCNGLIRYGYRMDSTLTLYVNNEITRKNYRDHSQALTFSISMRKFIHDNLDDLILHEKQLSNKYYALIPDFKELKRRIESQQQWEKTVFDLRMSRKKEMVDELPFFNQWDSLSRVKTFNHVTTNPSHKNKILDYYQYELNENIWDATLIRTSSVALLWKIKSIREKDPITIESFMKNLGLKPLQEFECGNQSFQETEIITFRRHLIIYNNTDDTVLYNHINKNGEILNKELISLEPKSFRLEEFSYWRDAFIEVVENDNCKKMYLRNKEDYLIFNL